MRRVTLDHPSEARSVEGWCVVYQWFGQWQALVCRDRAQTEHQYADLTNMGLTCTILHDGQPA